MPWLNNRQVTGIYATRHARNVWARVSGDSWHQLSGVSDRGLTHLASMLTIAQTSGRDVAIFVGPTDQIERVRLS